MQPVSSKWAGALATDHGIAVRIDVMYAGQVVAQDIGFIAGSVKVDRGSDVRRSLSLSIADPSVFPVLETDTFGVYGQSLFVQCGIRYMDGTTEMVPVGHFTITSVSGDAHTGPLDIQAAGSEILLKRTIFETAQNTKGSLNTADFVRKRIVAAIPGAEFVDRSTNGVTYGPIALKNWDAGTTVWAALQEVAIAAGAELFCDGGGTFVLADIPDVDALPSVVAWDITTGDRGVMVSAEMELTSDDVYNRVIVTGENASENAFPVTASATITGVSDPLRYGGPFGEVTYRTASSLVTTYAQALAMAKALLSKLRAPSRTVTLSTVPNPALDAGDWIRVDYGPGIFPELHLVHSFDIPLSVESGSFTIATVGGKDDVSVGT